VKKLKILFIAIFIALFSSGCSPGGGEDDVATSGNIYWSYQF